MLDIPNRASLAPRTASKSIWTPELTEYIKDLWLNKNLTCGQIAADLAQRGVFVTRCAVIGKIHRAGLAGTHPKFKPPGRSPSTTPRQRSSAAIFVHRIVAKSRRKEQHHALQQALEVAPSAFQCDGFVGLTFDELTSPLQCRWPQGDAVYEMRFCGQMVSDGTSYCAHHAAISLAPPRAEVPDKTNRHRHNTYPPKFGLRRMLREEF